MHCRILCFVFTSFSLTSVYYFLAAHPIALFLEYEYYICYLMSFFPARHLILLSLGQNAYYSYILY